VVSHSKEHGIQPNPVVCHYKTFGALTYESSHYRFTDIALKRNFDVEAASRYAEEHGLNVEIIDTVFAVHIKDKRVNKGTGLKRIAERMGIDLKEFAAIGDSGSDMPMFEIAGFRASVGNSTPELMAASDSWLKRSTARALRKS
jgi:hydroxymethylpyrimidine pyrophosphatase-like HAD family hydrolase